VLICSLLFHWDFSADSPTSAPTSTRFTEVVDYEAFKEIMEFKKQDNGMYVPILVESRYLYADEGSACESYVLDGTSEPPTLLSCTAFDDIVGCYYDCSICDDGQSVQWTLTQGDVFCIENLPCSDNSKGPSLYEYSLGNSLVLGLGEDEID
jgi:hypothetical protein